MVEIALQRLRLGEYAAARQNVLFLQFFLCTETIVYRMYLLILFDDTIRLLLIHTFKYLHIRMKHLDL